MLKMIGNYHVSILYLIKYGVLNGILTLDIPKSWVCLNSIGIHHMFKNNHVSILCLVHRLQGMEH